jgi:hypothetical protein
MSKSSGLHVPFSLFSSSKYILVKIVHVHQKFNFFKELGNFLRMLGHSVAAPAPAPTLLYSKAKFLKRTKV